MQKTKLIHEVRAVKNKKELKREIIKLMKDKKYYNYYSKLGMRHVERFHHPEASVKRLNFLCKKLLKGEKVTQKDLLAGYDKEPDERKAAAKIIFGGFIGRKE